MEKFLFIDKRRIFPANMCDGMRIDLDEEQSIYGVINISLWFFYFASDVKTMKKTWSFTMTIRRQKTQNLFLAKLQKTPVCLMLCEHHSCES